MRGATKTEQEESARLYAKAQRCVALCEKLNRIDPVVSPIALETDVLGRLAGALQQAVDNGDMRLPTCQRIMDLIYDIQLEICVERLEQLDKAGKG